LISAIARLAARDEDIMNKTALLTASIVVSTVLLNCGPGAPPGTATRFSPDAMKSKCDAKNHERPFIIEWDATDMSSFESRASNDLIFVKYEGCDLVVLDHCNDDSIKGSFGSYKPVEWTSGSLEKLDINDELELAAKLPLGVATLGGRVASGEKFHMEYYVAGTRSATRDAVYREDLKKLEGCKGATHFVYNYNLGAFGLGSSKSLETGVNASVYGFGADTSRKSSTAAEKKGGDLATCKSDSAKEVDGCKAPIRLTLRQIKSGENPDKTAEAEAPTDASLNAVQKVSQKIEATGKAGDLMRSAQTKMNSKDGAGCLKELDAYDKLEPKAQSTDPKSGTPAYFRSVCLMQSGKCDPGKALMRKQMEATGGYAGPEMIDKSVDAFAGMHCQGASMSQRDQLLKALTDLQQGAYMTKKTPAFCQSAYDTAKRLSKVVKPKDDDDTRLKDLDKTLYHQGAACMAKAGDCQGAWKIFVDGYPADSLKNVKDQKTKDTILKSTFGSLVSQCKDKAP
jgi:hypothetical protein